MTSSTLHTIMLTCLLISIFALSFNVTLVGCEQRDHYMEIREEIHELRMDR